MNFWDKVWNKIGQQERGGPLLLGIGLFMIWLEIGPEENYAIAIGLLLVFAPPMIRAAIEADSKHKLEDAFYASLYVATVLAGLGLIILFGLLIVGTSKWRYLFTGLIFTALVIAGYLRRDKSEPIAAVFTKAGLFAGLCLVILYALNTCANNTTSDSGPDVFDRPMRPM